MEKLHTQKTSSPYCTTSQQCSKRERQKWKISSSPPTPTPVEVCVVAVSIFITSHVIRLVAISNYLTREACTIRQNSRLSEDGKQSFFFSSMLARSQAKKSMALINCFVNTHIHSILNCLAFAGTLHEIFVWLFAYLWHFVRHKFAFRQ